MLKLTVFIVFQILDDLTINFLNYYFICIEEIMIDECVQLKVIKYFGNETIRQIAVIQNNY